MSWLLAAAVAASLYLADDGTPTIRYAAGHGGRFVDTSDFAHGVARSRFWSYDRECLSLEARRFSRAGERCGEAEFRLAWDEQVRDRRYPGVVRLRNGGALVFTQYLQPLTDDGRLAPWEARAPQGGVAVFRGEKTTGAITLGEPWFASDGRGYVYLGPDRFREERVGRVLVDDGVPTAIEREMLEVAPRLLEHFERRLGARPRERPSIYLTWVNREAQGLRDMQADVVPGAVIRFGLSGQWWSGAHGDALAPFRKLVAHELAHFWNAEAFTPRWPVPWITEGNAELLAVAALFSTGLLDAAAATEVLNAAYNECVLHASGRAWVAMREHETARGRLPYSCGMVMQLAIVAAARRSDPAIDAFEFWRRLWTRAPRYFEASIQQHLAATGDARSAAAVQAMLTDPGTPLAVAIAALLRAGGVAAAPAEVLAPGLRATLGTQVMGALMQADCKGGMSFYTQADRFAIAKLEGLQCGSFRDGQEVRYLEGEDLIEATGQAVVKARAACSEGRALRLKTRDGVELSVPCPAGSLPDPASLLRLDPASVAPLLGASPT